MKGVRYSLFAGILVRRLLVKTRTKTNTLSAGSNHVELLTPNGTVRSAKSDAVEMASDFQKKRQRTLQNVELQKQKIEEMFKGKGSGGSSLSLRHSNGYPTILNRDNASEDSSESASSSGGSLRGSGSLRFSGGSAFYPSRRFSKNKDKDNKDKDTKDKDNATDNKSPNISPNTNNSPTNTLTKQDSTRPIYFVKPTLTASLTFGKDNTASSNSSPSTSPTTSIH